MQTINIEDELKKIRLEYQLYELRDDEKVSDIDGALSYLLDTMSENDDKRRTFEQQERHNERLRNLPNFIRRAGRGFGVKDVIFLDKDSEFIAWQLRILDGFHGLLAKAVKEVNGDNYQEVNHLCRFAGEKYLANTRSVAELRRINLLASEGTIMERTLPNENSLFCESVLFEELDNIIKNSKGNMFTKIGE